MAKKGRKGKYDTDIKPNLPLIQEMAQTMTEKQIAQSMGVSYTGSWSRYKKDHPELREAIKKGRQNLVAELRSTLIKRAKGYEYTETKTTTQKVKWPDELYDLLIDAGFTDEQIEQSMLIKTEVSNKHMAPDVAALNLSLKNYDADNWANDPQMLKIRKKELELRERQIEQNDW